MSIALWMLVGGLLGWASRAFLRFNIERGALVSTVIGAVGGVLGGKVIAPLFAATLPAAAVPAVFTMSSMIFAAAVAITFIAIANLISNRWNV